MVIVMMMPMMMVFGIRVVRRQRSKVRHRQGKSDRNELRRSKRLQCSTEKAPKCEKHDGEFHSNPARSAHRLSSLCVVSTFLICVALPRISLIINRSDHFFPKGFPRTPSKLVSSINI